MRGFWEPVEGVRILALVPTLILNALAVSEAY